MPRIVNWLLRLIPTNPICLRLVSSAARRSRHFYLRSGYLAVMIVTLLVALLGSGSAASLRDLASSGANAFTFVSYLQLGLICLLAPIFMSGAIIHEANPRTWEILLTTPLNSLQIVLGNLFGRLFFILALLISSLPLFSVTLYFGGVPGRSIFLSYLIAAAAALLVGSIAISLSVTRRAGRRAVFVFYIMVVTYLGITWSLDSAWRGGSTTTWATPLNPFLAQEVLLNYENYHPHAPADLIGRNWLARAWLGSPVATMVWLSTIMSVLMMSVSTAVLRIAGQSPVAMRRGLKKSAATRAAREVWKNPIAWREGTARRKTFGQIVARYGFIGLGGAIGIGALLAYHFGALTLAGYRQALLTIITTEVAVIVLTTLNISATAISREREDGTLDILLTTPLTPSYYLTGKLRGIVSYIAPMIGVPVFTLLLPAVYLAANGLGRGPLTVRVTAGVSQVDVPFVLPEGVVILAAVLTGFVAFCVIIGLQWSLKSKGTIGSTVASVGVVIVFLGIVSLCGYQGGQRIPVLGAIMAALSPATAAWAIVYPETIVPSSLEDNLPAARLALVIGSFIGAGIYALLVLAMHKAMLGPDGRNFDMTVRRLAGNK